MIRGKDLISIRDLEKSDIELVLKRSAEMEQILEKQKALTTMGSRIAATLFFEPSTRTRLSFQSAVKRLGGQILNLSSIQATSIAKGETLGDTLRMVDGYADLLIIRHASEGAARYAAELCAHPVINAGDGGNQHPTQTLLDLYSIQKMKGKIEGLEVALVGDLKYARTMRSLLYGLSMFGANVTMISPEGLEMHKRNVDEVRKKFGGNVKAQDSLDLRDFDVAYIVRIQKERFADPYEAEKVQKKFRITMDTLKNAKKDLILLHPLPKVDEMDPAIDGSPYARYFEQARLGVPVRMAIISEILGI